MITIAVFTGGGETQALNATLHGVISHAHRSGVRVLGGFKGWQSLLTGNLIDTKNLPLDGIENIGGTFLRTSRTNPFKTEKGVEKIKATMEKYGIDALIAIGGDDTLGAANRLYNEYNIPIVAIPKTIDNDLSATHFTPGFPSAAENLIEYIRHIKRDCAIPRERMFLVESHGGNAGWLPSAAVLGGADCIVIPERKTSLSKLLRKIEEIHKKQSHGIIVISKEAQFDENIGENEIQNDGFNVQRRQHNAISLQTQIKEKLHINAPIITLGNLVRTGKPNAIDKSMAIALGKHAVELILQKRFGLMSSIKSGATGVTQIPLELAVGKYKEMTEKEFDFEQFLPTEEFISYLQPLVKVAENDGWYFQLLSDIEQNVPLQEGRILI